MTTATATRTTATVKVGDVFVSSWGYDQTNVDFYEVVRVSASGKTAKARKVHNAVTADQVSSERVVPATGADRFDDDARCSRCSNYHRGEAGWNGHAFTDEYGWSAKTDQVTVESWQHAYRWEGESRYQTAAGYGH